MKYRIYALIHGEIIPEGKIFDCKIKKLDFAEQLKRGFTPIQSVFSESETLSYHKTYVTPLRYIDPVRIKSEYVIICDIEEDKPSAAIGGAIKNIDRISRYLSLAYLEDVKRKFGRNRGSFEPYIYQVNKIYALNEKDEESEIEYKLESGMVYLPDRPESIKWRDSSTEKFLVEAYNFHDETFERALKYLYKSSIGNFVLDSGEKIALDHFKSIEIIVEALGAKRLNGKQTTFKQKLEDVALRIGITQEENKRIEELWDERSTYGDVAHPSPFDEVERYPNQFPIPSNTRYSGAGFDSLAGSVLLKYYFYIKGVYVLDISNPSEVNAKENDFAMVYEISLWGTTHLNHLVYYTSERDKKKLIKNLKSAFAKRYKIKEDSIVEMQFLPQTKHYIGERRIRLRIATTI